VTSDSLLAGPHFNLRGAGHFQIAVGAAFACIARYSSFFVDRHDPLFATFILQGIIAMLKSYPTLSDPGLFTAMHALFPELVPGTHH